MHFPLLVARRYLFAKKSHQAVNLITAISFVGVCIITAALVIILSVFNGFEGLINSLYSSFDPDLKIEAAKGKNFVDSNQFKSKLLNINGVRTVSLCLEEQVLLKHLDKQFIARIKGVDDSFISNIGLETRIREGKAQLIDDSTSYGIMGMGVAYYLGLNVDDYFNPVQIFAPNKDKTASLNPTDAFTQSSIVVKGLFSIEQTFDSKYLLVPLRFAEKSLGMQGKLTSLEVSLTRNANQTEVLLAIKSLLGDKFTIKTRAEQNEGLYKVLKSEKLYGFLIVCFIFLLAVINVAASMIMLIIEKTKDKKILQFLGADKVTIERIFLFEGLLIISFGLAIGVLLGGGLCWAQTNFSLIKLQGNGTFVTDSYPVIVRFEDILLVCCTVLILGFMTVWGTVKAMLK